jgi:hypothetical protein
MSDSKDIVIFDNDTPVDEDSISRIDRSGIIEPGHHWYCRQDVKGIHAKWENQEFTFENGLMYLLTSLVFFDGKLHSVQMLDDPSSSTQSGILTLPLLLAHFEAMSAEDAAAFRQQQIQNVHAQAAGVQKDMTESQVNPAMLDSVVAEGLAEWERELARSRRRDDDDDAEEPRAQLPALTTNGQFNLAGAVNHRISSTDIAVFRHMAQREGKIAEIRGKWLQKKAEQLTEVLKGLAPFYSEHGAVGLARAHEGLGRVKDVEKGLRSLNLYTLGGVTVVKVAEGASAPAAEPLTVYQRKLFMDEEFAVWDTVDRLFDSSNSSTFFEALGQNEALRQQLIPAPRGVVAMAVRRTDVKYDVKSIEEALEAAERNRENRALFLLIRDGENWYQVFSQEPSHELSPRLFPTRNEMNDIFTGYDGERIDFTDLRFTNRTNEFDAKSLAYKRFLILACGLDHGRKLFGDFYPEHEALSFISMEFQRKYMRFIADDDSDVMLGDNVSSVYELIAQNHGQLAPGSRVLVFSRDILSDRDACPGAYNNGTYSRSGGGKHYSRMVKPVHKALMLTVRRDKDDLVVSLPVERINTEVRKGWNQWDDIKRSHFSVRVALNKLKGEGLGYLITDTLRAEELRPYIYSRAQRAHHLDYIYGFKLAMQMLRGEEAANAPVLAHLEGEAKVRFGLTSAAAAIAATTATQSWRLKNPDAETLPAADAPEYANLDFELAEAAYAFTHAIPLVQMYITALGGKVVRVMRGKKGQLAAYYEQADAEKDARIQPWRWVGRRTFTAAGKPTKDEPQTVWLLSGRIVGETELFSAPTELAHRSPEPEGLRNSLTRKVDLVDGMAGILVDAFKGERQGVSDRAWLALMAPNEEKLKENRRRRSAEDEFERKKSVLLPVAVDTRKNVLVGVHMPLYDVLYHYGSDAQRAALVELGYTLPKQKKASDGKKVPQESPRLRLHVVEYFYPTQFTGPVGNDVHFSPFNDYATGSYDFKGPDELDFRLNYLLTHSPETAPERKNHDRSKYLCGDQLWVPAALRREDGTAGVSRLFPGLQAAKDVEEGE